MHFRNLAVVAALAMTSVNAGMVREILEARGLDIPLNIRADVFAGRAEMTLRNGSRVDTDEELTKAIFEHQALHPPPAEPLSKKTLMFPSLRKRDNCIVYCSDAPNVPVCEDADHAGCTCLQQCGRAGCIPYCTNL